MIAVAELEQFTLFQCAWNLASAGAEKKGSKMNALHNLFYRVARTKATPTSGPTGINELEGSVLIEADDYRRISNEVKSLKTALLKLKRELAADVSH